MSDCHMGQTRLMKVFDSKYVHGLVEFQSSNVLKGAIPGIADRIFWKLIYCNFQVRPRVINLWTEPLRARAVLKSVPNQEHHIQYVMLMFPASHVISFMNEPRPSSFQTILHAVIVENTVD